MPAALTVNDAMQVVRGYSEFGPTMTVRNFDSDTNVFIFL